MNEKEPALLETRLRAIRLSDFTGPEDPGLSEWKQPREDLPADFLSKLGDVSTDTDLYSLLERIDRVVSPAPGAGDKASSFKDSRFTPLADMISRRMVSCGAMALIFAETLRRFGVPVKLVHAKMISPDAGPSHRHAWIRIYDPSSSDWLDIDPTDSGGRFRINTSKHKEVGTYHSWSELRPDYERGDY